jgi:hypothetical protein
MAHARADHAERAQTAKQFPLLKKPGGSRFPLYAFRFLRHAITESTPAPPLLITDLKGLTFNAKGWVSQHAWPRAVFSKAHSAHRRDECERAAQCSLPRMIAL